MNDYRYVQSAQPGIILVAGPKASLESVISIEGEALRLVSYRGSHGIGVSLYAAERIEAVTAEEPTARPRQRRSRRETA